MALTANIKISELLTHPGESGVPRNPYSITGWEYVPVSWDAGSKDWSTDTDDRVRTYDSYKMALRDIGYYVGICIGVYSSAGAYDGLWDRFKDVETYTAAYGPRITYLEGASSNYASYFTYIDGFFGNDYNVFTNVSISKGSITNRLAYLENRTDWHSAYFDNIQKILDGNTGYYDYKSNSNSGANVYSMLKYLEEKTTYLTNQLFSAGGLKATLDTAVNSIRWDSGRDLITYTCIGGGNGTVGVEYATRSGTTGDADTVDGYHIEVVSGAASRYNANTIYFVTP